MEHRRAAEREIERGADAVSEPGGLSRSERVRHLLASRGAPLLVTAVLTAVAPALATWPLIRNMGRATLGSGEVLLTAWQLNWAQHALLNDPLAWVDANIFFPYANAATLNDLLLTHAVVTLPAAWADSPVLALNLALLGGFVLCGVFAHLLIVELTDAPWVATVGGTLFALTPFRFLHLGHLSIAAAWAIPLFFWALLRHLRQPSWGRAALAVVSGVAVALSSLYHAAYVAPIIPLVLLFGARRGPGGREAWLPLLATGLPGLALVASFLAPYATTLRSFGVAAVAGDLGRHGADLSSLAWKPGVMVEAGGSRGIDPEAHLYPGLALALMAIAGAIAAVAAAPARPGWRRYVSLIFLAVAVALGVGFLVPPGVVVREVWALVVLALIWVGPLLAMLWAIRGTTSQGATGPAVAVRLGVAGAALSFALALGPEARYLNESLGPAPYWLLTQLSQAFAGTRAPARFGGLVVLFLALVAAGALAGLVQGKTRRRRVAALVVGVLALVACFVELPLPAGSGGRGLLLLPNLDDPAYAWIRERPGRFGILELPDWPNRGGKHYQHRGWRSLRYMLASKAHGQHLVNGTGRIRPFLWRRFRRTEQWSDDFFAFIAAYFPVDYVLVHDGGIPPRSRPAIWDRLKSAADGWEEVFRSAGVGVYTIDRSFGRGTFVDRLFLRREIAPRARVLFSARVDPEDGGGEERGAETSTTLELLQDGVPVEAWTIDSRWRELRATFPVDAIAPDPGGRWPAGTARLSWRSEGDTGPAFEIRGLSVRRATDAGD